MSMLPENNLSRRIKPPSTRMIGFMLQILVFVFLYAPIFLMIVFSFNDSKSRTVWHGFTLKWYQSLFQDDLIISSLYTTLIIAVVSAVVATIIGTAAALGIHNMRKPVRNASLTLNNVPLVNPDILTGVSFMLLFVAVMQIFDRFGATFSLGYGTLLIAHITFNIPYIFLSIMPKLKQLNKHLLEAALDLGATPFYGFRKVILPEIMPAIISGMMIAFTMSIDDFVISYFTSGSQVQTLPVTIYAMTRKRISPEINALSTIMFLTVLLLLILINVLGSRDKKNIRK